MKYSIFLQNLIYSPARKGWEYAEKMKTVNINTVDAESLIDIKDVKIAPGLSKEERIEQFLRQIGNPYCFRCNGCVVQVSFSETERTLEDCLQDYFSNLV